MAKAVGSLVFSMKVDDSKFTPTLNSMKQEVRNFNQTMKANVSAAKEAGDTLGSYEARVEGLRTVVEKQKQVQESLSRSMKATGDRTKDNALQWDKAKSELDKATATYKNYQSQLDSATTKYEKLKTGISSLNNVIEVERKYTNELSSLYKAQGSQIDSVRVKTEGLEKENKRLGALRQKETEILGQIATKNGFASKEYINQATRVEQLSHTIVNNNKAIEQNKKYLSSNADVLSRLKKEYTSTADANKSLVDRLKAEKNEVKANITQASAYRSQMGLLNEQYKLQVQDLDRMRASSKTTRSELNKQERSVNETATSYARMKNNLRDTQKEIDRANPFGISRYASAANKAYRGSVKMQAGFSSAFTTIKDKAMSASLGIIGVGAAAVKGAKLATNLQDEFVKVNNIAVTGGEKQAEVTKNLTQMQKDAAKYSVQYGKSQQDIAAGYLELEKRGYTSTAALKAMKSELQASVATGDDFNNVLSVTSQVVDAYGLRTDNAAQMTKNTKDVVNQLAYAADMTATDFHSLGKGMEYVGDSAHSAGFALSEASSAMGILSNHGLEADKAGTGLRKVINSITGALSDQEDAQKGQAESVETLNGKIAEHQQKIKDYEDQVKAGTKTQKAAANATKTQQEAIEKLTGKVQAIKSGGTGDMLSSLGISRDKLVDSNGNLRDMTTIMAEINDKTKNMGTAQKNSVFNSLFGTTGQQAGIILAQNNQELDELNKKVKKSADGQGYVQNLAKKNMGTVKQEMKQFNEAGNAALIMIGKQMLPVISEAAVKMAKAFNSKEGQEGLKKTADGIAFIADKIVKGVEFLGTHTTTVKVFATAFGAIWATKKIGDTIGLLRRVVDTYRELNGVLKTTATLNAAANATEGVAGGVGTAGKASKATAATAATAKTAASGGGLAVASTGAKVASVATKAVSVAGLALTAWDVGKSVADAIGSKKSTDKINAASKTAGTVIGGGIGAIVGSIVPGAGTMAGAAIGAGIGDSLGSTKTANSIVKKVNKSLKKAFSANRITIKAPKIDAKDAYKDLDKASKKYYSEKQKSDLADIKLLKKNGYLTEEEYNKRLKAIKKEGKEGSKFEKLSQADRTAVTKYYAEQRQKLETSYNKKKKKDSDKWDSQIAKDAAKYGENSYKVQQDYKKKREALNKDEAAKKKAVNKLTIKNATETTVKEAKLHTTLTGKIKLSNEEQKKLMERLTKEKGKLSAKQLANISEKAKDEYEAVKKYADKQYNASYSAADKKYKNVTKAADRQFKSVKKSAESEHDAVIAASKKQFKGSSQWAKDQRAAVVKQADKQRDEKIKTAAQEHQGVYDKADKERTDSINAAKDKRKNVTKNARDQRDKVLDASGDQKKKTLKNAKLERDDASAKAEDKRRNVVNSNQQQNDAVSKGWDSFWSGMHGKTTSGLSNIMSPINVGIGAINSLIHAFGGSKNAIPKMATKFATGTGLFANARRPINELTLAMLNDGNDSPETGNKEMLIHPNGKPEIVQGKNVIRPLLPGTEVLNARETAMILGQKGITKFANGTGFFGDIWNGIKDATEKFTKMFGFITDAVANPVESLKKTFNPSLDKDLGSAFNGIGSDAFIKESKNQAKDWWKELWSMASDSASLNGVSGVDDYDYKNKGKDAGVDPWGYFYRECVSFVANRLKKSGVNESLFSHLGNGADWVNARVSHSKTPKPGSVAVYGPGSQFGNHVAMVDKVAGDLISGEEYNQDGDGRYHQYSGRNAKRATTFLDFGLSGKSKFEQSGKTTPMQSLIKSEVGGMFDWIKKFIAPLNDTATGSDNDVQSWSGDVKKALSKLGLSTSGSMVSKVLKQIQTESGGNAKAIGGNDGLADGNATGLMQVKPGTFRAYALSGHTNIMNGYDNILAGLNYAKSRYGSDLSFLGQGHGYANGGIATEASIFGEAGPEMAVPLDKLKRSRAVQLTKELNQHFAQDMKGSDNSSSSDELAETVSNLIDKVNDISSSNGVEQLSKQLEQSNNLLMAMGQILQGILVENQISNKPISQNNMNTLSKAMVKQAVRSVN